MWTAPNDAVSISFITCWQKTKQSAGAMWLSGNIVRGELVIYDIELGRLYRLRYSAVLFAFDSHGNGPTQFLFKYNIVSGSLHYSNLSTQDRSTGLPHQQNLRVRIVDHQSDLWCRTMIADLIRLRITTFRRRTGHLWDANRQSVRDHSHLDAGHAER